MIKVLVKKQSNYPVKAVEVKAMLREFFEKKGISSDAEVSIAFVGKAKMLAIAEEYLNETDKPPHNVLSFVPSEVKDKFIEPPDGIIHLGEIIVCFPVAFEEAKNERRFINEKIYELVEHGALHLLGEHHI